MDNVLQAPKFWGFLIKANEYLEKVLKPLTKQYGLTVSQLRIIYFASMLGRAAVGQIAKYAGFARTNTSSMCKKLSKMGFLEKVRGEPDERRVEIVLTESGQRVARSIGETLKDFEDDGKGENLKKATQLLIEVINSGE